MISHRTDSAIIGSVNNKLVINNLLENNLIKIIYVGVNGSIDS